MRKITERLVRSSPFKATLFLIDFKALLFNKLIGCWRGNVENLNALEVNFPPEPEKSEIRRPLSVPEHLISIEFVGYSIYTNARKLEPLDFYDRKDTHVGFGR